MNTTHAAGSISRLAIIAAAMLLSLTMGLPTAAVERTYHNPVLYADYSDPDVIRVGKSYYMVASTFHWSPGIPVLRSDDLVHWKIIGHVLTKLTFGPE